MSDVNRILTSLLLSHAIRRYFWRIVVIEVSYILERIFVFLEAQLIAHLIFCFLISNVFADFGFVSTYGMRFERSGRGQEPSRGHKFSILENVLSIRDFTSQTLASFPSDLVGVALVGATPLHLLSQTALPLKSPTGAFIAPLRFANAVPPQTLLIIRAYHQL